MTAVHSDTSGDTSKLSVFQLFQYASLADTFLMLFGAIAGIINGTTLPVLTIIFGEVIQAIVTFDGSDQGKANVDQNVRDGVIKMVSIGLITLTTAYIQMSFWMLAGENQTQDVAWFDKESTGDLTNRLTTSMTIIQEGISDKIGLMIQFLSAFFAGFIIGYIKGWQLALVLTGSLPFLAGAAMTLAKILASGSEKEQAAYGQAGGVAQQVLSSIRTVVSFGGEEYDAQRYSKNLDVAEREGIKKSFVNGAGVGMIQFLIMSVYALAFGYGNSLVPVTMNVGQVLNVIFAIIIGAFSLGNATPHISSLAKALGTAASIFATIDRHSPINPLSNDGDQLSSVNGEIEFKDVSFAYPSRPDSQILAKFNLHVKAGQTIALVGTSGSGKSTIVKLLERFYDPEGIITLDGRDIKDLNVRWLRQQIGMVSQEPALFDTSIKNNIAYGLLDYDSIEISLLDKQIEDACRQANCWDFIQLLPCKLDTKVGEAGGQLSGGQRQRICIARAIIKNPKILLLDEATSALDTQSERVVQDALDAASVNRTTIVIAHRLSTVQKADIIVVMKLGEIVEIGSPSDLLNNGGMYSTLVKTQSLKVRESSTKDATDNLNHTKLERSTKIEGSDHSRDDDLNSTNHLPKPTVQYSRLLRYNRFDGICAAMNGAVQPLFSILFSVILTTLGTKQAYTYSYMFIGLAFVAFISNFGQIGLFQYTGEKMTRRVREDSFRALLSQEIGFFDIDANSTGALTSKLAEDARLVQGLTGQSLGAAVQAISGMTTGLTIAFTACWQLSFVIVGMIPIIGMAGFFQFKALVGFGEKTKAAYEVSSQKASEAIMNIRTIITITQERKFFEAYCESIESPHQLTRRGAVISSLGFAFSQSVLHFAWATSLYYGAQLLKMGLYPPDAVLRAMFCVIFTAMAAGQIQNYTPDIAKAKLAALSIFTILDRQSLIDVTKQLGESKFEVKGTIDAQRLEFSYPTRKNHKILNGLDIKAMSGKTVALVGHSGCGKSTVLGLILRWYDVSGGRILFESLNIRDWNLKSLRSFVGVVGQEPILFNTSIRENIAYGALLPPDDLNIYEAAKLANIHDFIMTLPLNYDTLVGEKGGQLSGGQKQRTAIARALIRNPKLLLLDEATSALDSESELVVQEALDKAAKGRTTLVIAHRLSTIQNADLILVVDQGQISESGTHFDLIDQNGLYYQLVSQQQLLAN